MAAQRLPAKEWLARAEKFLAEHARAVGAAFAICGFICRLRHASGFYLNPDEAFHYWLAAQRDWPGWVKFAKQESHPELFYLILRRMLPFGHAEWILRLVPMAAGALFPWFVMVWVRRFASTAAALCAQLLLTFSPTLLDLSTEVRGYSLAFLFLSIALLLLESALDRESRGSMAWFHVFLWLSILSEECVAWFVAAAGAYAFARLCKDRRMGSGLGLAWLAGQAVTLLLLAVLLVTLTSGWKGSGVVDGWLSAAFPQPGQNSLVFICHETIHQFKYFMAMPSLGMLAAVAFAFGLYRLWKDRKPMHAMLLLLPFFLAALGGVFHRFPYGATRHTAFLCIAAAPAIGYAAAAFTRNRALLIVIVILVAAPMWNGAAEDPSHLVIPYARRNAALLQQSIDFLLSNASAGSLIATDQGTYYILAYYLEPGCETVLAPGEVHVLGGLRFAVAPTFQFANDAELQKGLVRMRRLYDPEGPIWVAADGFGISVTNPAANSTRFQSILAVFLAADAPSAPIRRHAGSGL